jgi:hypothetical protein
LLEQTDWCQDDASAHDHADEIEELLPHVAHEAYLKAAFAHELALRDDTETVRLDTLFDKDDLTRLWNLSRLAQDVPDALDQEDPDSQARRLEMAECLSLLAKERNGLLRHERLMAGLRPTYLVYLGLLIAGLLLALFLAVSRGLTTGSTSGTTDRPTLDIRAELVVVLVAGALGSVLAATLKLRDVVTLGSFRNAVRITYVQPLVGAAFGLVSWLVLTSGMVELAGSANGSWSTLAVVAFASGFSEPFALGILGRMTGSQP